MDDNGTSLENMLFKNKRYAKTHYVTEYSSANACYYSEKNAEQGVIRIPLIKAEADTQNREKS